MFSSLCLCPHTHALMLSPLCPRPAAYVLMLSPLWTWRYYNVLALMCLCACALVLIPSTLWRCTPSYALDLMLMTSCSHPCSRPYTLDIPCPYYDLMISLWCLCPCALALMQLWTWRYAYGRVILQVCSNTIDPIRISKLYNKMPSHSTNA